MSVLKRITLIVLILPTAVLAASKPSSGGSGAGLYRCRGADGQMHFGDSMPAECMGQDTEVVTPRGTVTQTIEGTRTQALKAQQHDADEAARKQQQDAELRDRMLVDTYLSVADIERLRDQRIDLVKTQVRVDEQTLTSLKDREQQILQQISRFKPYSDKPKVGAIPDHINEDMVNIVNGKLVTEKRLTEKRAEEEQLQNQFATDIRRFKELKGLK